MRPKKVFAVLLSAAMAFSVMATPVLAAAPEETENGFFDSLIDTLTGKHYT